MKQEVIYKALTQLIVVRNLLFKAVTQLELRALLLLVNYTYKDILVNSSKIILKLIKESFLLNQTVLKQKLQSSFTPIYLLLDAQTSPNWETFVVICAYFVNDTSKLRKALLALPFLPSKYRGDEQVVVLWQVLQEYNILNKIGYCVGNNHGLNNKLLYGLFLRLKEARIKARFNAEQH